MNFHLATGKGRVVEGVEFCTGEQMVRLGMERTEMKSTNSKEMRAGSSS